MVFAAPCDVPTFRFHYLKDNNVAGRDLSGMPRIGKAHPQPLTALKGSRIRLRSILREGQSRLSSPSFQRSTVGKSYLPANHLNCTAILSVAPFMVPIRMRIFLPSCPPKCENRFSPHDSYRNLGNHS